MDEQQEKIESKVPREKITDSITFLDFVNKYHPRIQSVADLVSEPFKKDTHSLEEQISTIVCNLEFLAWCLAWAEEFLINARHSHLPAKRDDLTEKDREVALRFNTSTEAKFRNWLGGEDGRGGLIRSTSIYLDKAQSVLAVHRAEIEKQGYGRQE